MQGCHCKWRGLRLEDVGTSFPLQTGTFPAVVGTAEAELGTMGWLAGWLGHTMLTFVMLHIL